MPGGQRTRARLLAAKRIRPDFTMVDATAHYEGASTPITSEAHPCEQWARLSLSLYYMDENFFVSVGNTH